MAGRGDRAWAGIDVGKRHHWVCVVDAEGQVLVAAKLVNDETEIRALLARVIGLADQLTWAVDIIGPPSALLLTMLRHAEQSVRYASGRLVSAMSAAYTGEGKTDAKDAYVIAETAPRSWTGVNERHAIALDNSDVSPVRSASRRDRDTARVSHHADTIGGHGQPGRPRSTLHLRSTFQLGLLGLSQEQESQDRHFRASTRRSRRRPVNDPG